MKWALGALALLLLILSAFLYFHLKKYLKKHENEPLENIRKGLILYSIVFLVITALVAGLGIAIILL